MYIYIYIYIMKNTVALTLLIQPYTLNRMRRRWRKNPSGNRSQERPNGVQSSAHREGMCGTGAGCLAIKYQSLLNHSLLNRNLS